jgi:hypothetical protein
VFSGDRFAGVGVISVEARCSMQLNGSALVTNKAGIETAPVVKQSKECPQELAEGVRGMNLSWWLGIGQRGASLDDVRNIVTIIGVIVAAGSLAFTAINTELTRRTSRARFWLDLRDQFAKYADVHFRLRSAGDWAGDKGGPANHEEWARVEAYMGLFEHCEIMLDQGIIDESTFVEIYRYRLSNIVANTVIRREKLCERASGWKRFLALAKRMSIKVNC